MVSRLVPDHIAEYEVLEPLGQGRMGTVYLAKDNKLDRPVAIKFLRGDLDTADWHDHLEKEAKVLAQLNHPNILQIYSVFEYGGAPALVTEYVPGRNLRARIREKAPSYGEVVLWLSEISAGLEAAHSAGISHNDLKADNILIGQHNHAKIADFGVASMETDRSGDVLALGELAREVASPFLDFNPRLNHLVGRLTGKKPSQRPSAGEAADVFRDLWIEATQAETPVPGSSESSKSWRDNRTGYIALGIVLTVLLTGFLLYIEQAEETNRRVIVLPTTVNFATSTESEEYELIQASVEHALYQSAIQTAGISLVSPQEVKYGKGSNSEVASSFNADELISSELDCNGKRCQLSLERLSSENSEVLRQASTTILPSQLLESKSIVGRQWRNLFDLDSREHTGASITEEDYRQYLLLYQQSYLATRDQSDILDELDQLLYSAPRFLPSYLLYAHAALEKYDETSDSAYLAKLHSALRRTDAFGSDSILIRRAWFELAIESGNFDSAREELESLEKSAVDASDLLLWQGDFHLYQGEYEEAAKLYSLALDSSPTRSAFSKTAYAYYYTGQTAQALATVKSALELYEDDGTLNSYAGQFLIDMGNIPAAINYLQTALAKQPHAMFINDLALAHMLAGNFEKSLELLSTLSTQELENNVYLLNLADSYALTGDTLRAEEFYRKIVNRKATSQGEIDPIILSQALAHLGQYKEALSVIQKGNAMDEEYLFASALVNTLSGETLTAIIMIEQSLDQGFGAIWYHLPWFDRLCAEPGFSDLIDSSLEQKRCPRG